MPPALGPARGRSHPRPLASRSQGGTLRVVQRSLIIGTAGHIDHGKTTLIRALTGVDCDRLDEEKKRCITIVLGFAPLTLSDGQRAGVVDVPGHERFVRTMVAGAGGVDIALLVVSAEEGVMPQTREHLDILNMLRVPQLVVAVTRADLVDEELLELAELDAQELLAETPWPDAPVLAVSGLTGQGVPALLQALTDAAATLPQAPAGPAFRMAVDRSFSLRGFGTVVTGTTRDGVLNDETALEVLPGRTPVRVRGIQVHGEGVDRVVPGTRVALNLQGIEPSRAPAGAWLAARGSLASSDRLDVEVLLLAEAPRPLPNNARVRFLYGTAEVLATVRLLDGEGGPAPLELLPGETGLAQLALEHEIAAVASERFVLRAESPVITLGGGRVLDPSPPLLRRRGRAAAAAALRTLRALDASDGDRVEALLARSPGAVVTVDELRQRLPRGLPLMETLTGLQGARAVALSPDRWAWTGLLERWRAPVEALIDRHHTEHPLLTGPLLGELRQALRPEPDDRLFAACVPLMEQRWDLLARSGRLGRMQHTGEPEAESRAVLDELVARFATGGTTPAPPQEIIGALRLPPDALLWLLAQGELVKITDDFLVARAPYRDLVQRVVAHTHAEGLLTPAAFKELSGLTRKHAIPFLEHLDRERILSRTTEGRALRSPPRWCPTP